jgi:hypothetical protein
VLNALIAKPVYPFGTASWRKARLRGFSEAAPHILSTALLFKVLQNKMWGTIFKEVTP